MTNPTGELCEPRTAVKSPSTIGTGKQRQVRGSLDREARRTALSALIAILEPATGADRDLDCQIHRVLGDVENADGSESKLSSGQAPPYTKSVSTCIDLAKRLLPRWKWHLGYGVKGVLPYAALSNDRGKRRECGAPTVPLALILAIARVLQDEA